MNDVQERLDNLIAGGWTQQAISDEMGVSWQAVHNWKKGQRYPENSKAVMMALDGLTNKKPPPKRRYSKGHYLQRRAAGKTDQ